MEFSRQQYWSELPFPNPGDLPDPGSNLCLLHWQAGSYGGTTSEVLFLSCQSSKPWLKKAKSQRNETFKLWCWRRLLKETLFKKTLERDEARRSKQLILREIKTEYSLEGLMLKLKLQYFGHLLQRVDSL